MPSSQYAKDQRDNLNEWLAKNKPVSSPMTAQKDSQTKHTPSRPWIKDYSEDMNKYCDAIEQQNSALATALEKCLQNMHWDTSGGSEQEAYDEARAVLNKLNQPPICQSKSSRGLRTSRKDRH